MFLIKTVTQSEMDYLVKNNILRNTKRGYVNSNGFVVGFYRTRTKRYLEDRYVDMARKSMK